MGQSTYLDNRWVFFAIQNSVELYRLVAVQYIGMLCISSTHTHTHIYIYMYKVWGKKLADMRLLHFKAMGPAVTGCLLSDQWANGCCRSPPCCCTCRCLDAIRVAVRILAGKVLTSEDFAITYPKGRLWFQLRWFVHISFVCLSKTEECMNGVREISRTGQKWYKRQFLRIRVCSRMSLGLEYTVKNYKDRPVMTQWKRKPGALLLKWINVSTAWISDSVHYNVWNKLTYAFPNFNVCTIEVWEWTINFTSCFTYTRLLILKSLGCSYHHLHPWCSSFFSGLHIFTLLKLGVGACLRFLNCCCM